MTSVNLNTSAPEAVAQPTPSQAIVAEANRIVRVTDALGRSIGVRRMTMSIRRRMFKAISAENQGKDRYLGLAMVAACVCEIDGQMIALPANELQLDALIDRLDDAGFEAAADAISTAWPSQVRASDGSTVSAAGE